MKVYNNVDNLIPLEINISCTLITVYFVVDEQLLINIHFYRIYPPCDLFVMYLHLYFVN